MISSWFKGVLVALLRNSAIAIDCLFGCFRVEADNDNSSATQIVSGPLPSHPIEPVASRNRNRLYSLLPSGEKEVSPCKGKGRNALGILQPDIEVGELNYEGGELEESLKVLSIQKLNLDNLPAQPPTPTKLTEEWVNSSGSLPCTPCSSLTSTGQRCSSSTQEDSSDRSLLTAMKICTNQSNTSREDLVSSTVQKSKNKFVHFECGESGSSSCSSKSSSSSSSSSVSDQQQPSSAAGGDKHRVSKNPTSFSSPYPTPFKLTDTMQTPGTVFSTSYQAITTMGKNPRIRSQYVYSIINPIQTFYLPKKVMLEEEEEVTRESLEQAGDDDIESTPKLKLGISKEDSLEEGLNVESILSSQLRASPTNQNTNNKHPFRSPNSASKNKEEDEKVDLQVTPFEERLEKAFSGETAFIS